jgi:hypothetical protein
MADGQGRDARTRAANIGDDRPGRRKKNLRQEKKACREHEEENGK